MQKHNRYLGHISIMSFVFAAAILSGCGNKTTNVTQVQGAAEGLSVYGDDDVRVGELVGMESNIIYVLLDSGYVAPMRSDGYLKEFLYYQSADCTGTPLVGNNAYSLPYLKNKIIFGMDSEPLIFDPTSAPGALAFGSYYDRDFDTCNAFSGSTTLSPLIPYTDSLPTIVFPLSIR